MTVDDGHHLYERRRLRRRLGFWRLVALLAVTASAAFYAWQTVSPGTSIARFRVDGPIFDDADRRALLTEVAENGDIAALILHIDSPGGSVVGSEALYESIRAVAARKPVVAVLGEVAASGGYIAAAAADRIIARGNTITGSIGVIAEFPNVERLLETLGIEFSRVASAPLKAEPSPLRTPSAAALAAQEAVVEDAYGWFRDLVGERRTLAGDRLEAVADGRIFSGRQALTVGLIDALGDEATAVDWLRSARGIDPGLPVRDIRPRQDRFDLPDLLGLSRVEALLATVLTPPRPMAIWQPQPR